jgi:chromate transporter
MSGLSIVYSRTNSLPAVVSIFNGLQAVIVAVMANATLAFGRTSLIHWKDAIIALVAAGLFGFTANPVFIVALSAMLGILLTSGPNAAKNAIHADQIRPTTLSLLILLVVFGAGFVLLLMLGKELFQLAILMSKSPPGLTGCVHHPGSRGPYAVSCVRSWGFFFRSRSVSP